MTYIENNILKKLAEIEILKAEIKAKREIHERELEAFMPKDVGSVNYEKEHVKGGISVSEETSIIEFAGHEEEIQKLEKLLTINQMELESKRDALYKLLTDSEKQLFELRYIKGKTVFEIAIIFDRTERQIFNWLKKMKIKLKGVDKDLKIIVADNI